MCRQRGFTLLEVMIAVAIFSLLAMGTYRMLSTVLKTDEATRQHERDPVSYTHLTLPTKA